MFAVRNFRQKRSGIYSFKAVEKNKKKVLFFIVRLKIVCMFAAAKKCSKNDQRKFGMI